MPDRTPELLATWREHAKGMGDRLWRFARWTKLISPGRADQVARETHEQVFAQLDCTKCANCCRTMHVALEKSDIKRLAQHFQMSEAAFREQYVEPNEQGQPEIKSQPCPFLADSGACTIYAVRPKTCADFPHTNKRNFSSRSWSHGVNVQDCPAVFHILDLMQQRLGYRDRD